MAKSTSVKPGHLLTLLYNLPGVYMTLSVNPPNRWKAMMAELPSSNKIVMYGGKSTDNGSYNGLLSDCWTWNGTSWTYIGNNLPPGRRYDASMAHDGSKVTMFGGTDGQSIKYDSWSYNGTTWAQNTLVDKFAFMSGDMAYISGNTENVLFGGRSFIGHFVNDTFIWQQPSTFMKLTPSVYPPGRADHCMASSSTTTVLFGGTAFGKEPFSDTWTFTTSGGWTRVSTTGVAGTDFPSARFGASMVYDAAHTRWILFGGCTTDGFSNQTWAFNGTSWSKLSPATSPAARADACMAYDSTNSNVILFAGRGYNTVYDDTWILSSTATWTAQ